MARWMFLAAAAVILGIGAYQFATDGSQAVGGGSIAAALMFVAAAVRAGRGAADRSSPMAERAANDTGRL